MSIATVVKVEPKTTAGGKSYWRAQFNPGGWASTWSGTFGKMLSEHVGKQVNVDLQKTEDGKFTNIVTVSEAAPANPEASEAQERQGGQRDHLIVRQVALKAAVEWGAYSDPHPEAEVVIAVAEKFAAWIESSEPRPTDPDEIPF